MKGTVSDTAFKSLAGVRVEVIDGPAAGVWTTTDDRGEFSLRGAFDDTTRFRATQEGYASATETLGPFCAPCNPNRWIHFELEVLAPPVDIAGDYTVTFTADPACAGGLPLEVRTRTYTTTIPPSSNSGLPANAYTDVTLSGATFYGGHNRVELGVAGDQVGFWIEPLIEEIAPNTLLVFNLSGSAAVQTSVVSTISASAQGGIDYCVLNPGGQYHDCFHHRAAKYAACSSGNHRLILTRR